LNDTTGLMVNVTVVPAPSGGGGGGGGGAVPQSVVVVTGADNQTLFTVQTETGASSSQLLMYPSQKRLQTYIVQSYVQNDLSLDVSCEGNFCSFVSFSSDKLQLAGMQSLLLRAELSMPSSAQYGDVFQYSVRIADAAGRSALLQNQVQVSRLSRWYSKFLPVVREGDSGFWFGAGSYAVPKLLLYLLLVGIAVTTAYLLLPKERRYRDVATLVYVAVGLFTFVVASLVY